MRWLEDRAVTYSRHADSKRLIRDAGQVKSGTVFAIGVLAGGVVSIFTYFIRAMGISNLNIELLFADVWWLGLLAWLAIAGTCAYAYAFIFWSAHRSGAGIGLNLGIFHWLITGFIAGVVPLSAPGSPTHAGLAPAGRAPLGFYLFASGFATSAVFFLSHALYGACIGAFFDWAAMRDDYPRPLVTRRESKIKSLQVG